ncbi:MAG: hypothetical protein AAFR52_02975 [Pseudomonadota bacterium]
MTVSPDTNATEAGVAQTDDVASRSGWDQLAAVATAVLLVAGACYGFWSQNQKIALLEAALADRPGIRIADYTAIREALAAGHSADAILPLFVDIKTQATRLAEAGYIVLNRATVEGDIERFLIEPAPTTVAALGRPRPSPFTLPAGHAIADVPHAPSPPLPVTSAGPPPGAAGAGTPVPVRAATPSAAAASRPGMSDAEAAALLQMIVGAGQ